MAIDHGLRKAQDRFEPFVPDQMFDVFAYDIEKFAFRIARLSTCNQFFTNFFY
jgi:hypothetical protein